ncbi:MAG: hypothetical protein ABFC80_02590 [Coriobacteriales bacterium]|nr:hypothetical protein [Actinomycetes bacterium]
MSEVIQPKMCAHCGAVGEPRLGYCDECGGPVCARCGNVQLSLGKQKVLHDMCLKHGENTSFSMIRFVR